MAELLAAVQVMVVEPVPVVAVQVHLLVLATRDLVELPVAVVPVPDHQILHLQAAAEGCLPVLHLPLVLVLVLLPHVPVDCDGRSAAPLRWRRQPC